MKKVRTNWQQLKFYLIQLVLKTKNTDWQLFWHFLLWLLFSVDLSSINRKKLLVILATKVSPIFHLHCYSQNGSIVTCIEGYSVRQLLLKCFRSIKVTKLRVKIVVPQLHESIFPVTGRDVWSGYCIVLNAPTSPVNSEMIWKISLLKSTARKKIVVKFMCKLGYQEFPGFYALGQHINTWTVSTHSSSIDYMNILWSKAAKCLITCKGQSDLIKETEEWTKSLYNANQWMNSLCRVIWTS